MGWAKYFEDNLEIVCERQEAMQARAQGMEIEVVCPSVLPIAKLVVEVKKAELVIQIQTC